MKKNQTTTAARGWNVGSWTGGGIDGARLSVFKGFAPNGKARKGDHDGRVFANSDDADEFLLSRGYSQHWGRNCGGFEVSRAARKNAVSIVVKNCLTETGYKNGIMFAARKLCLLHGEAKTRQILNCQGHPVYDLDSIDMGIRIALKEFND